MSEKQPSPNDIDLTNLSFEKALALLDETVQSLERGTGLLLKQGILYEQRRVCHEVCYVPDGGSGHHWLCLEVSGSVWKYGSDVRVQKRHLIHSEVLLQDNSDVQIHRDSVVIGRVRRMVKNWVG